MTETLKELVKQWNEVARIASKSAPDKWADVEVIAYRTCANELSSALAGIARPHRHCDDCDLTWSGPYTDCPGCFASAGMQALRSVKSLAVMLGWENVPPQDTLEAEIRALKARAGIARPSEPLEEKELARPSGASVTEDGSPSHPLRAIE